MRRDEEIAIPDRLFEKAIQTRWLDVARHENPYTLIFDPEDDAAGVVLIVRLAFTGMENADLELIVFLIWTVAQNEPVASFDDIEY